MKSSEEIIRSHKDLMHAIQNESKRFQDHYLWLEKNMPTQFFTEISQEDVMLVAHNLMAFHLQDYFSEMRLKDKAVVMCLDSIDADLSILKSFRMFGIKNYRAFVSEDPPPSHQNAKKLRIAVIHLTTADDKEVEPEQPALSPANHRRLLALEKERNPEVSTEAFQKLIDSMNQRFLRALPVDRLVLAIDMFFRARTRDHCQYEVRYNEDWKEKGVPSMQIMLAWRNTPKYDFLYRLARTVHRHGLVMQKVNASYVDPYSPDSILVMALGIQGAGGEAAWDVADIPDFFRELVTLKYFADFDLINNTFIIPGLIRGNLGNLLRSMISFVYQVLVNVDPHLYTFESVAEGLCRHPEITVKVCAAFEHKFHPDRCDIKKYQKLRQELLTLIEKLDTGHEANDTVRKNVLCQSLNFIEFTHKTNFYRNNKMAFSFRLDPQYLDHIPFDRKEKFPELPYAIFFIKGMHFFGFHIRFKDLSRGGLRTVFTEKQEQMVVERRNIFTECYNLAYTQQKKNKDIPEGGSKGVILLKPNIRLEAEMKVLKKELEDSGISKEEIEKKVETYQEKQTREYLYQTQRAFINSMLTLINCEPDGQLRAKHVVDYWKRPEYIYLGPDENMHNNTIEWIAALSKRYNYKPRGSFISSKPKYGINHKEYGVTSLGVNVYMHEVLQYLGIEPNRDPFTVKISGGPDGDVAGNQIRNLYNFYPKTARILALTDVSGTIFDPKGIDLKILYRLFQEGKSIRFYPPEELHEGGFLLDRQTKQDITAYAQQTLCWRKKDDQLVEDWLSGNEMNYLFRNNVHQTITDVFIPAGGRPRTISSGNVKDFLDERGVPTSRAIVEGANLYLTSGARRTLEEKGVLIIKDSSANKGGVICSSYEVLCGLTLGDKVFYKNKENLVQEIIDKLQHCAHLEAKLLLRTHQETGERLTDISDKISAHINTFTYQILDYLETIDLPNDPKDPLIKCFLAYCLPTLRTKYRSELLENIPDHHKKAIIACHIASRIVYTRDITWFPSIVDILPIITHDAAMVQGD